YRFDVALPDKACFSRLLLHFSQAHYVRLCQEIGWNRKYGDKETGSADADQAPQPRDHWFISPRSVLRPEWYSMQKIILALAPQNVHRSSPRADRVNRHRERSAAHRLRARHLRALLPER